MSDVSGCSSQDVDRSDDPPRERAEEEEDIHPSKHAQWSPRMPHPAGSTNASERWSRTVVLSAFHFGTVSRVRFFFARFVGQPTAGGDAGNRFLSCYVF